MLVEALISRDLMDEVLVSWHDLIKMGVHVMMFPARDTAQVQKVESANGSETS